VAALLRALYLHRALSRHPFLPAHAKLVLAGRAAVGRAGGNAARLAALGWGGAGRAVAGRLDHLSLSAFLSPSARIPDQHRQGARGLVLVTLSHTPEAPLWLSHPRGLESAWRLGRVGLSGRHLRGQ